MYDGWCHEPFYSFSLAVLAGFIFAQVQIRGMINRSEDALFGWGLLLKGSFVLSLSFRYLQDGVGWGWVGHIVRVKDCVLGGGV